MAELPQMCLFQVVKPLPVICSSPSSSSSSPPSPPRVPAAPHLLPAAHAQTRPGTPAVCGRGHRSAGRSDWFSLLSFHDDIRCRSLVGQRVRRAPVHCTGSALLLLRPKRQRLTQRSEVTWFCLAPPGSALDLMMFVFRLQGCPVLLQPGSAGG